MARGAAPNQSSTTGRGAGRAAAPPAGSAALIAARRRRSTPGSSAAGAAPTTTQLDNNQGVLKFYTDDAPGLKIGPTTVLVLSLTFIGFVVLLHIWGKFRAA